MIEKIDRDGFIYTNDFDIEYAEKEMIRSHDLSLKISSLRPTDPNYKELLEELLQDKIDDMVSIVSPFYCDFGSRLKLGKNITINKGTTIFSAGIVEINDDVLIGPDVKIISVNPYQVSVIPVINQIHEKVGFIPYLIVYILLVILAGFITYLIEMLSANHFDFKKAFDMK